jgi:hypothetical protein
MSKLVIQLGSYTAVYSETYISRREEDAIYLISQIFRITSQRYGICHDKNKYLL